MQDKVELNKEEMQFFLLKLLINAFYSTFYY